jgi:hypothetical protein
LQYESLSAIPWYAVFGNHDYGNGQAGLQAQIDMSNYDILSHGLWHMPAANYTESFAISGSGSWTSGVSGGPYLQIVFIDTTTIAPLQNKYTYEYVFNFIFPFRLCTYVM